jgi:hypothetical protein
MGKKVNTQTSADTRAKDAYAYIQDQTEPHALLHVPTCEQVLDKLLPEIENRRGKLVVILAGEGWRGCRHRRSGVLYNLVKFGYSMAGRGGCHC